MCDFTFTKPNILRHKPNDGCFSCVCGAEHMVYDGSLKKHFHQISCLFFRLKKCNTVDVILWLGHLTFGLSCLFIYVEHQLYMTFPCTFVWPVIVLITVDFDRDHWNCMLLSRPCWNETSAFLVDKQVWGLWFKSKEEPMAAVFAQDFFPSLLLAVCRKTTYRVVVKFSGSNWNFLSLEVRESPLNFFFIYLFGLPLYVNVRGMIAVEVMKWPALSRHCWTGWNIGCFPIDFSCGDSVKSYAAFTRKGIHTDNGFPANQQLINIKMKVSKYRSSKFGLFVFCTPCFPFIWRV